MDAIAGLLDGPRARGAFLLKLAFDGPWSVRIQDESPIAVISVVRGAALIFGDGDEPIRLEPGDVAVARGPRPYTIADATGTPVQAIVHPGQECKTPDGQELKLAWALGTRTWGNAADGAAVLMTGVYESAGEISSRLLRALPPLLVQRLDSPLIALLADEIVKDEQGQEAVLDRLLDLILIAVLRAYFARPEAPGWYRAYADPVVGPAIRMLHSEPAHPWTIQELAHRIGVSRAALARRFNDLVGEPPMAFLTGWRIALAADLLLEPGATVGSVAPQVGYGSSFALSTAFKRLRGISPQQYRTATGT
ncbi:AraC family transcriptional regulator [Solirubrobacter phytolaccae]|uniref:AraC family transcriptional regulator n=1 Tax=Solirubrobacter phytolaccae TaxID=1404360 RepID=A0A9X3NJY2_9ACTN|nr:AraC family transcriptional regulator [Solirubrobacter phytolaccae]MDA0182742.1 AraC family transcriptional regulator [Solirubrobacter phytolaccae]